MVKYLALAYLGTLLTACAQVLLKAGARRTAGGAWYRTYFSPFTLVAYAVLLAVTVVNLKAFTVLPFKFVAITLPANYLLVGLLARLVFGERLNRAQGAGALMILAGIAVFFL